MADRAKPSILFRIETYVILRRNEIDFFPKMRFSSITSETFNLRSNLAEMALLETCLENQLTLTPSVVIFDNMKAELIHQFRNITDKGHLIEVVIWRVPDRVSPCAHPYKYRLVYIVDNLRVIGYDNERGKGDHRHLEGIETPYEFVSIDQLIDDFIEDVERRRNA